MKFKDFGQVDEEDHEIEERIKVDEKLNQELEKNDKSR